LERKKENQIARLFVKEENEVILDKEGRAIGIIE
jgi:DNA-binding transcriptional regulator/RsmH inhibitor MraZ